MAKGGSHLPPSHHNNICLINNTHLIIFGLTTRLLNKFPSPSISGLPLISFTYWLLPHARPPPAIPVQCSQIIHRDIASNPPSLVVY